LAQPSFALRVEPYDFLKIGCALKWHAMYD